MKYPCAFSVMSVMPHILERIDRPQGLIRSYHVWLSVMRGPHFQPCLGPPNPKSTTSWQITINL